MKAGDSSGKKHPQNDTREVLPRFIEKIFLSRQNMRIYLDLFGCSFHFITDAYVVVLGVSSLRRSTLWNAVAICGFGGFGGRGRGGYTQRDVGKRRKYRNQSATPRG
jgi:hypothetical protein